MPFRQFGLGSKPAGHQAVPVGKPHEPRIDMWRQRLGTRSLNDPFYRLLDAWKVGQPGDVDQSLFRAAVLVPHGSIEAEIRLKRKERRHDL